MLEPVMFFVSVRVYGKYIFYMRLKTGKKTQPTTHTRDTPPSHDDEIIKTNKTTLNDKDKKYFCLILFLYDTPSKNNSISI